VTGGQLLHWRLAREAVPEPSSIRGEELKQLLRHDYGWRFVLFLCMFYATHEFAHHSSMVQFYRLLACLQGKNGWYALLVQMGHGQHSLSGNR
jgi:hypothetical protein